MVDDKIQQTMVIEKDLEQEIMQDLQGYLQEETHRLIKVLKVEDPAMIATLLQNLHERQCSVFLLADVGTEMDEFQSFLETQYTNVKIVGKASIPDSESSDDMIANQINGEDVECILAWIQSDNQTRFIERCEKMLNAKVWIGLYGVEPLLGRKENKMKQILNVFNLKQVD